MTATASPLASAGRWAANSYSRSTRGGMFEEVTKRPASLPYARKCLTVGAVFQVVPLSPLRPRA